ncbi:zinc ribbon domain-containing protein [Cellulomonas sp.]|uniref:zinc ribbon domain-containing protein n=1 Tax=Cellulomonas sp. TaxID=40001 RepID=UPI00281245BE|nr:zinc ribbon domain-containing protein [Cellulomonas sp.]
MVEQQDDLQSLGGNFRAEDLSRAELEELTVLSERESEVLRALESPGQRLLIGPRGSGKSTYLKLAYYQALDESRVLPVYVNYSKSITLEPTFRTSANALPLFRQWLLAQIVYGAAQTLLELGLEPPERFAVQVGQARELVSAIERRRVEQAPETTMDVTGVLDLLEVCVRHGGRRRAVLLLDDAAHAFAPEQQREFFEVFGALRSRWVSAKAAVYPGVTSYTPRFHVGHDAQLIDVWLRPDQPAYLEMLREIAAKRLDRDDYARLERREGLLEYLALASFGIPRTFIVMLAKIVEENDATKLQASVLLADEAIVEASESALKVFTSLQAKLPRYRNFVEVGRELVDAILGAIREYNDGRMISGQSGRVSTILVQEPFPPEVHRIVGLLEYAGVVRLQPGTVSNGPRTYRVLVPHYALLISRTALGLGRNPSVGAAVTALNGRESRVRLRRQLPSLLGADYVSRCRLDLGACAVCGAQRENAEARFCANCGSRLEQVSVFEELLDASVEELPISSALLARIREHSDISKIKHILLDEERQALLKIPYIGQVRAVRIRGLAEEFVYE